MFRRNVISTFSRSVLALSTFGMVTACADLPTSVPEFALEISPTAPAAVATTFKSTGKFSMFYYGNWCGKNWSGGTSKKESAIDRLDTACQNHDRDYATADAYWGKEYRSATTKPVRASACTNWRLNYFNANNTLVSVASKIPGRPALEKSMKAGEKPDVWSYDSRVFGPHPRTASERDAFRDRLVTGRFTGLFKDPPCHR